MKARKVAIQKTRAKLTLKKLLAGIKPDNLHVEQDWGSPVGKEILVVFPDPFDSAKKQAK